jgi:hypothetical protein
MAFIDFLYANLKLGVPKGMEDRVVEIPAHKGIENITAFYQFSPEELEQLNRTGGVWISQIGGWRAVKIETYLPIHRPRTCQIYGPFMTSQDPFNHAPVFYLDLALLFVRADADHSDFIWRELPQLESFPAKCSLPDGTLVPAPVFDLEFRDRTSPVHVGGRYLFSETLEVLGRFKDLPKLQPIAYLFPFLQEPDAGDWLVLAFKDPLPEPEKRIIPLYE